MDEKVSFKERVGFSFANLGNIPVMTLVNTFLLIYYTDVIKLNPAAIGTLFLIARFMDAISDPIMGFIIDHFPNTKRGRLRPILALGSIVLALNFALLWYGPLLVTTHKLVIVYISYLLLGVTFDVMDIPLNSLIPVMSRDDKERNIFTSVKSVSISLGQTALTAAAPIIIASASSKKNGYVLLIAIGMAAIVFFSCTGAALVKERNNPKETEKYGVKELLKIFCCRPVMSFFFTGFVYMIGLSLINGTGLYYATYVLKNPVYFSVATTCGLVGSIAGGGIIPMISTKIGKKLCYQLCLLVWILSLFILFLFPYKLLVFYGVFTVFKAAFGGITALKYSISADNVDYVEWKLGVRGEAALASINSLNSKVGNGVGGAFMGYMLALIKYVPNKVQTPSAVKGIINLMTLCPMAVLALAAIIFTIGYNLNKHHVDEIHTDLEVTRSAS